MIGFAIIAAGVLAVILGFTGHYRTAWQILTGKAAVHA